MRRGVTLIELLVTMTIIAIIAAAVLGTAASAIESGREKKTISTIAKIHGLVGEKIASYETRRVDINQAILDAVNSIPDPAVRGKAMADMRLLATRELMKMEMPDRWTDVEFPPQILSYRPGLSHTYFSRWKTANPSDQWSSAECLYLLVMAGTGDGEARTLFTTQEIGDVDQDGCREFIDGWGNPIGWQRWPIGYAPSTLMSGDASTDHDPFDPYQRDIDKPGRLANHFPRPTNPSYPAAVVATLNAMEGRDTGAFRIVPLIWSRGPDGEQQFRSGSDELVADADPYSNVEPTNDGDLIGSPLPDAEPDDITNHGIEY